MLGLVDVNAIADGRAVAVDGVLVELAQNWRSGCLDAYLFVDAGVPHEDRGAEVCQALLSLQLLQLGEIEGMFVHDAVNDRLMFGARITLWRCLDGAALAILMRALASRAMTWRRTLLAQKLEQALDPRNAAGAIGFRDIV